MKKEELIQKAYEIAVERYAAVGVDTEKVLKTMQDFHLSLTAGRLMTLQDLKYRPVH